MKKTLLYLFLAGAASVHAQSLTPVFTAPEGQTVDRLLFNDGKGIVVAKFSSYQGVNVKGKAYVYVNTGDGWQASHTPSIDTSYGEWGEPEVWWEYNTGFSDSREGLMLLSAYGSGGAKYTPVDEEWLEWRRVINVDYDILNHYIGKSGEPWLQIDEDDVSYWNKNRYSLIGSLDGAWVTPSGEVIGCDIQSTAIYYKRPSDDGRTWTTFKIVDFPDGLRSPNIRFVPRGEYGTLLSWRTGVAYVVNEIDESGQLGFTEHQTGVSFRYSSDIVPFSGKSWPLKGITSEGHITYSEDGVEWHLGINVSDYVAYAFDFGDHSTYVTDGKSVYHTAYYVDPFWHEFNKVMPDTGADDSGWVKTFVDWVYWRQAPYVYSPIHGYMYCVESSDGLVYFDTGVMQWVWTSDTVYPHVYFYGSSGGWAFYGSGVGPGERWFYDFQSGDWIKK